MLKIKGFGDLSTLEGKKKLDEFLSNRTYFNGVNPSQNDCNLVSELLLAGTKYCSFPHICRYLEHMRHFTPTELSLFPTEEYVADCQSDKCSSKHEDKSDKPDDDFDLFGDNSESAADIKKVMEEKKKALQEKKKEKPASKSSLVLEIKPSSLDVDLDEVAKLVRGIKIEGVEFSSTEKKVPIAFGLFKLQMGATIIDDLVNTQDIIDNIETLGMTDEQIKKFNTKYDAKDENEDEEHGLVQSCEIVSFNKL
ncbi:EF-1 guanine nucleotide exchange domain-containing protein [Cryptosporidium muris RN66]|uniref:EF-1 guanine nucleotide exchange domain-containing protein n=1 Tax=Cryptosporidium muris (strain RN66) TaxID=441375 RepID=B6AJT0_CRYMR|nr:EF-1 guanine nucleotide exchange domain-containing protein [Cryptosporidium muris RN66]EEA08471.1 EF-1 guanine nucleotide exchange domain-containing protein [Cryptosporidium muris RN66]|eukprot:XP_002142820.1 EF-1 guanine nucleotide exchange domain-containing protein [Cryptosporidium muris RN66]